MELAEGADPEVIVCGDEGLNEKAVACVDSIVGEDESLIAVSGFDFEKKVLAITDQRVLVAGEEGDVGTLVLSINHDDISPMTRDGRTLIIKTRKGEEYRYRFGKDQTVEDLVEIARSQQTIPPQFENVEKPSIAERVRFWEEQDKINQELIPRVIRQHKLLTAHIADHENLPLVAGNAVSEALAKAREEQQRHYDAALDSAKTAINNQAKANLDRAAAALNQEWRKTRNILIGITAASGATTIAAIIVGILI